MRQRNDRLQRAVQQTDRDHNYSSKFNNVHTADRAANVRPTGTTTTAASSTTCTQLIVPPTSDRQRPQLQQQVQQRAHSWSCRQRQTDRDHNYSSKFNNVHTADRAANVRPTETTTTAASSTACTQLIVPPTSDGAFWCARGAVWCLRGILAVMNWEISVKTRW